MDKLVHDNQERMREGPQLLRGINPRIMQVQWLSAGTLSEKFDRARQAFYGQPAGLQQASSMSW